MVNQKNCVYDGPAKPLNNATAAKLLLDTCYDLDVGMYISCLPSTSKPIHDLNVIGC